MFVVNSELLLSKEGGEGEEGDGRREREKGRQSRKQFSVTGSHPGFDCPSRSQSQQQGEQVLGDQEIWTLPSRGDGPGAPHLPPSGERRLSLE